jgi:mono/diheme cytochrome c family protein
MNRHHGLFVTALLLSACARAPESPLAAATAKASASADATPMTAADPKGDPVEGLRVATRVGCLGCHGADGGGRKLWAEPGKFQLYSANLTEKRALYDDAGLEALLRQGRTHDGHVPFGMPVLMYQHLSDREVRDITAWLRTMPAVANPDLKQSWFADDVARQIRAGTHPYSEDMRPDPGNRPPAEPPAEPLALGRHLAMTSCPECHGRDLNGFGGDEAPPLVVAKAYSAEQFARLMQTGITASSMESASGLMTSVGRDRLSVLTENEVRALKQYLDSR